MLVRAPPVEAEQNRSIGIEDLPKVIMGRKGSRLTEQRLVPLQAARHVAYPKNRPRALHCFLCEGFLCADFLCELILNEQKEKRSPSSGPPIQSPSADRFRDEGHLVSPKTENRLAERITISVPENR
jgi:hypothetical protein